LEQDECFFMFNDIRVATYNNLEKLEKKPICFVILNYYNSNKIELVEIDTNVGSKRITCESGHVVCKTEI